MKSMKLICLFIIGITFLIGCEPKEPEDALNSSLKALQDADPTKRADAVETLAELKDPIAVLPLVAALKDDAPAVRENAVQALAAFGEPAISPLINALDDDNLSVRKYAMESLLTIGEPAIEKLFSALKRDNLITRQNVAGIIAKLDPDWLSSDEAVNAVPLFIRQLGSQYEEYRENAIDMLELIGEPAMDLLLKALVSDDKNISENAGRALIRINLYWTVMDAAKKAVPVFIKALLDKEPMVRSNASRTLIKMGDSVKKQLILTQIHENWEIQRNTEKVLNIIDKSWYESKAAISAVPVFIKALDTDNNTVRLGAVTVLGKIDDFRIFEPLISLVDDEFLYVRKASQRALQQKTGQDFGNDAAKWLKWLETGGSLNKKADK